MNYRNFRGTDHRRNSPPDGVLNPLSIYIKKAGLERSDVPFLSVQFFS